ncbi:DUF3330 domain-containing protein [Providencia hangzhouensis]
MMKRPTLPVAPPAAYAAKKFRLNAAFTPEGAEYVEHFCGLDCYERFQVDAPRPRQNLTLRLSLAVRSRQIEAYPNLMSDAMCHFQKTMAPVIGRNGCCAASS